MKTSSKVQTKILLALIASTSAAMLTGCATAPTMGENKGTVSGAAGGATAENKNSKLEACTETLGTLAMQEDVNAPWYVELRNHQLGTTLPVLRLMVQQSNCFVIVERGRAMANMSQERDLQNSGEMRGGSNFGKGQMVAADFTMSPSIQFSAKTAGGMGGFGGGLLGLAVGVAAASVSQNEASTTLLLIDNRSGVQISAAEGTAKNMDFGFFGAAFAGGLGAVGGGYANTPQGKVIVTAFADSYNQMVKSLRSYKAQTVAGGLGKGGTLRVDGDGGAGPALQNNQVNAAAPVPAAVKKQPNPKPATKATSGVAK